jgi:hypothetical protein
MDKVRVYLDDSGRWFKAVVPECLQTIIDPDRIYSKTELEQRLDQVENFPRS